VSCGTHADAGGHCSFLALLLSDDPLALTMHLAFPCFLLLAALILAWRREWIGALVFLVDWFKHGELRTAS
jgi:hypothetical protein